VVWLERGTSVQPQVWYKACPPRLPEYLVMILEC
jgi:hypothetical protein